LVSRVAFGCAGIAGHDYGPVDREQAKLALLAAVDSGVTLIDVANVYGLGRAEQIVGEVLKGVSGVTIATKVGLSWDDQRRTWRDIHPQTVRASVDASLRRLRRDVLDLVQVHWPDGKTPVQDAVGALVGCVHAGKVRAIGICNFSSDQVGLVGAQPALKSLQLPASLIEQDRFGVLRQAQTRHGLTPLCYNVLGQGLLTGKYARSSGFAGTDVRQRSTLFQEPMRSRALRHVEAMRFVARQRDATIGQVAIRWLLDALPGACAVVGSKSADQAIENARMIKPLLAEERAHIELEGDPNEPEAHDGRE
jgi:aryl-alcohol dehydrogenase-like predicted oxidoreductase